MAEKQEKIIIAGFDLTDYVAQKNATSMRLFGEPSEDVTPSDLLDHCLYLAKTIEQRKAILNVYKAHPEKYPDMDTSYNPFRFGRSKKKKDILAMLEILATEDPMSLVEEIS